MYIVNSAVKKLVHSQGKRIGATALKVLDIEVCALVSKAITLLPKHIKTITPTEIANARVK